MVSVFQKCPQQLRHLVLPCKGFYLCPIHVSWEQEGEEVQPETFTDGILSTANDKFYIWTSLELGPISAMHHYACQVEHSSLLETSLTWGKGCKGDNGWGAPL